MLPVPAGLAVASRFRGRRLLAESGAEARDEHAGHEYRSAAEYGGDRHRLSEQQRAEHHRRDGLGVLRATERQAAEEMGQWGTTTESTGVILRLLLASTRWRICGGTNWPI